MAVDSPPDIEKIMMKWNDQYTTILVIFGIITVVLGVGLALLFSLGNLVEISKNFPRYRCNPIVMPFASNFGYNTADNFNYCMTSIFNVKAMEIFTPIYKLLAGFTDIIQLIVNVALSIREIFSNFLLGVNRFIRSVRDRIQGVLFNLRMTFLRMTNLMRRVYATMYAVIWMGVSATTAGMNVSDNGLVQFLFEFCFDPSTPIIMADGTTKHISDLVIGDKLSPHRLNPTPTVTSVFRFDGSKTPMVRLNGITLSAEHYVHTATGWVAAKNIPGADPIASIPELVCLNVTGHAFKAGCLIVADYDEHDTPTVIIAAQNCASKALNGISSAIVHAISPEYSLGIDGRYHVRMVDGSYKLMAEIKIGDRVWNSGTVLGIVQESCTTYTVNSDGLYMAAAQLVYRDNSWKRTTTAVRRNPKIVYSLITERCSTVEVKSGNSIYYIRDYREVPLPDMEEPYRKVMEATAIQSR